MPAQWRSPSLARETARTWVSILAWRVAATQPIARVSAVTRKMEARAALVAAERQGVFGRRFAATGLARCPMPVIDGEKKMWPHPIRFVLMAACVGCGADVQSTNDASLTDSANIDEDTSSTFPDAWQPPGPVLVDGGTECGIPVVGPCHSDTLWTCCNGVLCGGACLLFPDAASPECYCPSASLHGGCPSTTVCCDNSSQGCIAPANCGTSRQPPPGGCPDGS